MSLLSAGLLGRPYQPGCWDGMAKPAQQVDLLAGQPQLYLASGRSVAPVGRHVLTKTARRATFACHRDHQPAATVPRGTERASLPTAPALGHHGASRRLCARPAGVMTE